jgi:hypothetical protein
MELLTIPKSWVEDKIKVLNKNIKNNMEKGMAIASNYDRERVIILKELLENSKSAEEVFKAK